MTAYLALVLVAAFSPAVAAGPPAPPPPPVAPIALQVGGQFLKTSREDAARRALGAMAKEKLVHAELTADGSVLGWDEKTIALVTFGSHRDGVNFMVVAAGKDNDDAGRLRDALREHVQAAGDNAAAVKPVRADGKEKPRPPVALRWTAERRNPVRTLRFFQPAGYIAMEKQGLRASDGGMPNAPVAFGGSAERVAVSFLFPGPNEVNVQIITVGVALEAGEADRLQQAVHADLAKVLYE